MKKVLLILVGMHSAAFSMEKYSPLEMKKIIVKELVRKEIAEEERKKEVDNAVIHFDDEKGVIAANGTIFIVDYKKGVIDKQLIMQSRNAQNKNPAIVALCSIKNMLGSANELFLMAEEKGRILLLDEKECELKMIGDVHGRVLSIAGNPAGNQIAVHFTQNSAEKSISSIALSVAYTRKKMEAKINADKSRTWYTKDIWQWTQFITKHFDYEIEAITFEEEQLIVHSADYWENWFIKNPENNPEFVLNITMKKPK